MSIPEAKPQMPPQELEIRKALSSRAHGSQRTNNRSSANLLLHQYKPLTFLAFCSALVFYLVILAAAVLMISTSFLIVFLPELGFNQKVFGVGVFLVGSGLILIVILRNPLTDFQQFLTNHVRTQIVMNQVRIEQDALEKEVEKLKKQAQPVDQKQLELYMRLLEDCTEKAVKNLFPHDDLLE